MSFGIGVYELLLLAAMLIVASVPAYEVARRSGVPRAAVAFIPFIGPWLAALASVGASLWLALLLCVPYLGAFALGIWLAVALPRRHERNPWWTVALLVPVANLVTFYAYAFTLRPALAAEHGRGEGPSA